MDNGSLSVHIRPNAGGEVVADVHVSGSFEGKQYGVIIPLTRSHYRQQLEMMASGIGRWLEKYHPVVREKLEKDRKALRDMYAQAKMT